MPDRPAQTRQFQLIRFLSSARVGWTLNELSERFEVSEKTIRRDIGALLDAGFAVRAAQDSDGRKLWRVASDSSAALPGLSLDEAVALHLGRRLLEPLAGSALWDSAQSALSKLRRQFSRETLEYLDGLSEVVGETGFGQSDYSERATFIDELMEASQRHRIVKLLYHPLRSDRAEPYRLQPLSLVWHRRALYLIAAADAGSPPRHFKVDRIRDVEVTADSFAPRTDFDLQTHLRDTLGVYQSSGPVQTVEVRFAADVARHVTEHQWHHSQQLRHSADGAVIVRLQLRDMTELKSWVRSFGRAAEVLTPTSLRQELRVELEDMLASYVGSPEAQPDRERIQTTSGDRP